MRFVDRIIKDDILVIRVLRKFFGLGTYRINMVCVKFGLPLNVRMKDLSTDTLDALEKYLFAFEFFSKDLRQAYRKALIFHKSRGNFRGIRLWLGLPVRGQRSHTNASTVCKLYKGVKFK